MIRMVGKDGFSTAAVVHNDDDDATNDSMIIPKLALEVVPEFRGQGMGFKLLAEFLKVTKQQEEIPEITSTVSRRLDNLATMKLYERREFKTIPDREKTNRVGGTSVSMIVKLN